MALKEFTDAAGRTAFVDPNTNMVFTEGGNRATNYSLNDWNARQLDKYGSSSKSSSSKSKSKSSSSISGSSGGSFDYQKILQDSIRMAQEANKPVIQSLQASIPETQQRFETERTRLGGEIEPLKQRYQSLLESIKGKEATATERQTVATSNELGKRGILPSSGVAQQEMVNALNPITREFAGLTQETGLAQEADLRAIQNAITGLTGQQTAEERAIQNAIAQLQSGAIQTGANTGISLSGLLQNQQQFNAGQELARQQQALAERQFNEVTLPNAQRTSTAPSIQSELASFFGLGGSSLPSGGGLTFDQLTPEQQQNARTSEDIISRSLAGSSGGASAEFIPKKEMNPNVSRWLSTVGKNTTSSFGGNSLNAANSATLLKALGLR